MEPIPLETPENQEPQKTGPPPPAEESEMEFEPEEEPVFTAEKNSEPEKNSRERENVEPVNPIPLELAVEEEELPLAHYNANNVIFLVDVSLSMGKPQKLPLLKKSMNQLVEVLRDVDQVAVMTYSTNPTTLIGTTSADQKDKIMPAIESIKPSGMTYGVKGLEAAYEMAHDNYIKGGNNQIIISTDGLFNSPKFDQKAFMDRVKLEASRGIIVSVIGFGDDSEAIKLMKKLARVGEGNFIHISDSYEARFALINEIKDNSKKSF